VRGYGLFSYTFSWGLIMKSIFPALSLDRDVVKWENHLGDLTPWENHKGLWFKREDYFAPLGYGGPNGSKMRQLTWYVNRFRQGKTHIVTGASIQSPQLSMTAIVGAHYHLKAREIVYSKPHTVLKHDNPRIAAGFGAVFDYANGPYNPILQKMVSDLTQPKSLVVEYGITVPHEKYPADDVRKFHEVGAHQVSNMPDTVTRLVMPAGSCNSLTSVLLGLSRDSKNLDELFTVGIGPDKRSWVRERLKVMGVDVERLPFKWSHFSLHDTGYSKYSDHFTGETFDGIKFHPTYEAKMWRWLTHNDKLDYDDTTAFWIVGSAPNIKVVEPFYTTKE
jgi:1-aminocyclopropane-1-carboxylate deaminase/D-cysteine desulfhydrase-like pyridoxal-dependent ACC family enzyme